MRQLDENIASRLASIALGHVGQEFPNKLDHVMAGARDAQTPRALHPAFYGSFDWHSCVHSWWTLLTLRRFYPAMAEAASIEMAAEETLTAAKLDAELAYARRPESRGFERPYGWAWLLYLHLESSRHADREWSARLEPLARHFADGFRDYLPKLVHPITTGTHANTAFALTLSYEWAGRFDTGLRTRIADFAISRFGDLPEYRGWDVSGDSFLSPVLSVSQLMKRVLPSADYRQWLGRVLPTGGWLESECQPVCVTDPTDGKMAHLDGLNLSRAWALRDIASQIGDSSRAASLQECGRAHLEASVAAVDGDYMGSHWLASFALLALVSGT